MMDRSLFSLAAIRKRRCVSMKCKIFMIIGLYTTISLILFSLSYIQSNTMNSVRSYVRGEGLWAKAQKDAVFHLQSYVQTSDETFYYKFRKSLEVPLGDRKAREMMQSGSIDRKQLFRFFIAGQNHPEDIGGMIDFFLRFEHFPYMSDAIVVWTRGDQLLEQLSQLGEKVYEARQKNESAVLQHLLVELDNLNWKLADQEYEFSAVLSEGARWVKRTLFQVSIGLLLIMFIAVVNITRHILKGIEKTERDLLVSENRFRSLYQSNMLGILDWHGDGRILDANDAFLNMLGYLQEDAKNGRLNWREMTPENGRDRDNVALSEIAVNGFCTPFEKEFLNKDGIPVPVFLGAALLDGEEEKGICFVLDQTERKRTETQLRLAATVFDSSSEGIIVTDNNLKIVMVNKAFCNMTEFSQQDVIGKVPRVLQSNQIPELFDNIRAALNASGAWQGDSMDYKQDGTVFPVHLSINAVNDQNNITTHYVAIYTDITEQKAAEDQLRKMAHYDFLTGLANRTLFDDYLERALQRARRHKNQVAVLFIDIDKFKPVNDIYGHEIGDRVLQEIAARLECSVRESDTVARIGGDEFIIILEDITDKSSIEKVAQEIIVSLQKKFIINELSLQLGSSIGISLFPDDGQNGVGLTRCADIAMYAAKASGSNQLFFYNDSYKTRSSDKTM